MQVLRYVMLLAFPVLAACNLAASTSPLEQTQATPADAASDSDWFAYVYNPQYDELLKLAADGTQTTYALGLGGIDNTVGSAAMSFNEDGSRVAFCQVIYEAGTANASATLYVRDIAAATNVVAVDLGRNCWVGRGVFANNQVVVRVINDAADASLPVWELIIFDTTTGARLNSIDANSHPLSFDDEAFALWTAVPTQVHFNGTDVIFKLTPYPSETPLDSPAYQWNVAGGTVERVDYWGRQGIDVLDTGELAFPDYDESLPAGTPQGMAGTYNVLRVVDGGEPRTVYHSPDWVIVSAQFINNGQQIAMLQYPSFDPAQTTMTSRWVAVDRAGAVTEIVSGGDYSDVMAAPNGFVALEGRFRRSEAELGHYSVTLVQDGTRTVLWERDVTDNTQYELAWSVPTASAGDLAAFATFTP